MALNIPNSIFDKYYEACDWLLSNNATSREVRAIFRKKKACTNCTVKMVGSNTTNTYRHGGPAPFNFGTCSLCGGNGICEEEHIESLRMRVYFEQQLISRAWKQVNGIDINYADVMCIGNMSDVKLIKNAIELHIISNNKENDYICNIINEPRPWGFFKSRYFIIFLKRV